MHRVLPVPGRVPRAARPPQAREVHRAAVPRLRRGARDAPARRRGPARGAEGRSTASATATSPSAARRCAPSTSRSPTTRSSRSRSASSIGSTIRSRRLFRMLRRALMFELKPLSTGAIPAALAKAERYRLLNEPGEARKHLPRRPARRARESGGARHAGAGADRSVPDRGVARAMAARGAGRGGAPRRLRAPVLRRHHPRASREGRAGRDRPGSHPAVHEWLREAMGCYERPKRSGRRATTTRSCAGTRARGF